MGVAASLPKPSLEMTLAIFLYCKAQVQETLRGETLNPRSSIEIAFAPTPQGSQQQTRNPFADRESSFLAFRRWNYQPF
jgi:hypothetical protein